MDWPNTGCNMGCTKTFEVVSVPLLSASQLRLWLDSSAGLGDAMSCGAIVVWTILKIVKVYKIERLAFSAPVSVEKECLSFQTPGSCWPGTFCATVAGSGLAWSLCKEVRAEGCAFDIRADDLDTIATPAFDNMLKERYDAIWQKLSVNPRTCP